MGNTDMEFWDEEFTEKLQELKAQIDKVEKANGFLKSQELQTCQQKLKQVEAATRRGYCMEMRQQPSTVKYTFQQVMLQFLFDYFIIWYLLIEIRRI